VNRHALTLLSIGLCALSLAADARADDAGTLNAALESITTGELEDHIGSLADDTFEGREGGSRGGRAAAGYLVNQFKDLPVEPAGEKGTVYQVFNGSCRNILVCIPGSDPDLKEQIIVVGAHYDHVGYGNPNNSFGPTGYIHNGADDNASGTAGLLEMMEGLAQIEPRPRRTILFAWWDAEEQGLLGSDHWTDHPTRDLAKVELMVNMDMIGRMTRNRLEVYGIRSAPGLRRLVADQNGVTALDLDFNWDMREDSDHYSFYRKRIPVLMLHTGLHKDYHRPSDDAEKINYEGTQGVARLCLGVVLEAANREEPFVFRPASSQESRETQFTLEPRTSTHPGRLGITFSQASEGPPAPGVAVAKVAPGSAAEKGGIRPGDRIMRFWGHAVNDPEELRQFVVVAENPVEVVIERTGTEGPIRSTLELDGSPVRFGITWRIDDAEPGVAVISKIIPGSPAARGGLKVSDRVYSAAGRTITSVEQMKEVLLATEGDVEFLVERRGVMHTVHVPQPPARGPDGG
jgi:hypothetical protein